MLKRLFIAVDLPDDVKERLADICFGIPRAKWVSSDQIHLTVRFIGEVDTPVYNDIVASLDDVIASKFEMLLKGTGFFPPRKHPKVLWAGVENPKLLTELRDSIEYSLLSAGIDPEERNFSPHITIARLDETVPIDKIAGFLSHNAIFASHPFMVTEFHLYSSILTQHGAIHHKEHSWNLL